jgi:nicotinate phosphoribosyltransferase
MRHSYVQAHEDERAAFRAFARQFPGTVVLVDTYDTLEGVRRVIEVATSAREPVSIGAVRLDSGDLAALSLETRRLLDEAGLGEVKIFASSGLDEHKIAALVKNGAPIDGFGVGTGLDVSDDAPSLDIVYKLSEYEGRGLTKLAQDKPVLPGRKQVFRQESGGMAAEDVIARVDEAIEGRALLEPVMKNGLRTRGDMSLLSLRQRASSELARLPRNVVALDPARPPYPVRVSAALGKLHADVSARARSLPGRP